MTGGDYRQYVARRIADGQHLEQIEAELIDPAQLPQDEKDALWLYALACEPPSRPFGNGLGGNGLGHTAFQPPEPAPITPHPRTTHRRPTRPAPSPSPQ